MKKNTDTWYYEFAPAEDVIEGNINLILTVTAEDGKTTKDYNITVKIDRKAPEVKSAEVNKKSDGSLVFNLDIGEKGKLYYILTDASEQPPERGNVLNGTEIVLSEGVNEISLEQGSQGKKIYYMLKDEIENLTGINAITIPKSPSESAANKISVSFRLIGSTHVEPGEIR